MQEAEYITKAEHDRRMSKVRARVVDALDAAQGEILRGIEGSRPGQEDRAMGAEALNSGQAEILRGLEGNHATPDQLAAVINKCIKQALADFVGKLCES